MHSTKRGSEQCKSLNGIFYQMPCGLSSCWGIVGEGREEVKTGEASAVMQALLREEDARLIHMWQNVLLNIGDEFPVDNEKNAHEVEDVEIHNSRPKAKRHFLDHFGRRGGR